MKKKILLCLCTVLMLVCLFAISASASEIINGLKYDLNSNGTARLTKNGNQSVEMEFVNIPETVVGADGKTYTVTEVHEGSFRNNKNIKYVSLPPTITLIGGGAFNSCSNLVFVDFNNNQNDINMTSWGVFRDCTSLKAVCLPDNVKTIGDQAFTNCKALTAVYLPARVEHIKGNKSAGDGPAFGNSPNMYLVNEKFEVRDENGNFYTADTFELPAKPQIYYFPSTLKTITGPHNTNKSFAMDENGMVINTGAEDCAFYNLPNLNSIIVLPEGYCGYDDRSLNSSNNAQITDFRGDTISSGLFQKCGTKESPLTIVFLGKIDRISMGRKGEIQYTTFVFANEANTSFENTKIGTWYNTSDTGYSNQNEIYAIFCHANNGEGAKYKIALKGSADDSKYPVLTSELQDGATHIIDTKANEIVSNPTCTLGTVVNTFCFCGGKIDEEKEIFGTALGHEFDLEKGATKYSVVYANYLANGILNTKCARCEECSESEVNPIISSFKGYSIKEDGNGITFGYTIDYAALDEFAKINGKKVDLGFVVAAQSKVTDNKLLNADGSVVNANVIKASIITWSNIDSENEETVKYSGADFKLTGNFTGLENVVLCMAGYLFDGAVAYLNANASGEASDYITYGELVAVTE